MAVWNITKARLIIRFVATLALINATVFAEWSGHKKENKNQWRHDPKTLYEITSIIHADQTHDRNRTLDNVYSVEGNASSTFYYEINEKTSTDVLWTNFLKMQNGKGLFGLSFIIYGNASIQDVLNLSNSLLLKETITNLKNTENSIFNTLIISVAVEQSTCPHTGIWPTRHLPFAQLYPARPIQLGFEYSRQVIEQCEQTNVDLLELVDHAILKIKLSPVTTMLSYGIFSEMMTKLVRMNRQFVRKHNPKCTLSVRLVISNWNNTFNHASFTRYEALVTGYFNAWREINADQQETYIITPLSSTSSSISENNKYLQEKMQFAIYGGHKYMAKRKSTLDLQLLACEPQEFVRLGLEVFQNILFDSPTPEYLQQLLAPCRLDNESSMAKSFEIFGANSSIVLRHYTDSTTESDLIQLFNLLDQSTENILSTLNVRNIYVDSSLIAANSKLRSNTERLLGEVALKRMQIDCYVDYSVHWQDPFGGNVSAFVEKTVAECGNLMDGAKEILCDFQLMIQSKEHFFEFLKALQEAMQIFESRYPSKKLIPAIRIMLNINNGGDTYISTQPTYCDGNVKLLYEYLQTIVSYSNIHNWTSFVVNFASIATYGLWRDVVTDSSIDRQFTNFPVLWRSNSESVMGKALPMTFPCIQRAHTVNETGIDFLSNNLSGATTETRLRRDSLLTTEELQMAVRFALGRFPSVELITRDKRDFILARDILSPRFLLDIKHARNLSLIVMPLVYIEIPISLVEGLQNEITDGVDKSVMAVHLRDWESHLEENFVFDLNQLSNISPHFGSTVQNCSHEIKLELSRLKKLAAIFKAVNYIVCNMPPLMLKDFSGGHMERYMGTIFYIKSYIERYLPKQVGMTSKIEVMFRINVVPSRRTCPVGGDLNQNSFLRFLNVMNQHSAAYRIRYFIVRAFEADNVADQCPFTWWHIKDYSDLTNVSVYVDTEREYFGLETKLRIPYSSIGSINPHSDKESKNTELYLAIFVPMVLFIFSGLVIYWLLQRRFKKMLLTRNEINQFYNGSGMINNEMEMLSKQTLDSMHVKFPKKYEVAFRNIEIGALIGSGQFGLVHKGMIRSEKLEVAIKIPRSGCDKEQFMSTLSELKILGYIGNHPNVVSFLGACTKKIGVGKLYILTEYCENGSLLSFLRNLQTQHNNESTSPDVDLYQLYGFSQQIASGMEYVANKRVIHGDLATRNILLTCEFTCKVADFGLSRRLYELNEYKKSSKEPLPWRWMAPECLINMEFTTNSDVWSFGVTLWEIFSLGKVPYPGRTWTEAYVDELEKGMRMGKAQYASVDLHKKILECWNLNREERPTFTELKQFFADQRNIEYLSIEEV